MTEILTESFCERCGTRYTFESARPKVRLKGVKVLSRGLKNFVLSDDTTLDEAMAAARSEADREVTVHQLDAFHKTFSFCMSCRQYTCPNCWNEVEARCLSCAPRAFEVLPAASAAHSSLADTVLVADLSTNGANGQPQDELPAEAVPAEKASSQTAGLLQRFRPGQSIDDELAAYERAQTEAAEEATESGLIGAEAIDEPGPTADAARQDDVHAAELEAEPEFTQTALEIKPEFAAAAEAAEPEPEVVAVAEAAEPEPEVVAAAEAAEPEPEVVAVAEAAEPEPEVVAVAEAAEPEPEVVAAAEAAEPEPEVVAVAEAAEPEPELAAAAEPEAEPVVAAEPEPEPVAAASTADIDIVEQPTWRITAPEVVPRRPVPGPPEPRIPLQTDAPMPPVEPQWPARPEWPAPTASAGLPFLGRPPQPEGGVEALWAESNRELAATPPPLGRAASGIQPCISCGLSLSATARFCRRCGTLQVR